ncbi:AAA family ATPase [Micromonospora sp. NPDC047557]|uniref:AAA family ATPase n=1 Tax=Micromonospora sp. NPDC047557 TaxID=3364250 RepID=UPI00371DB944
MHLSKITVHGFRASAEDLIECEITGRFSVLIGANNAGKSTVCDALYLTHRLRFSS